MHGLRWCAALVLLAGALLPTLAQAQPLLPVAPAAEPVGASALHQRLVLSKVGVAVGVGIVALAAFATYRTATMCRPDDDDCPLLRGMAYLGDGCLFGLGLGIAAGAAWTWAKVSSALRAAPTVVPASGGAVLGLAVRF